jgi:hypothetical protein
VISDQNQRVILFDQLLTVLPESHFMISPDRFTKLTRSFQFRLKMEMQVSDCKQAHKSAPLLLVSVLFQAD